MEDNNNNEVVVAPEVPVVSDEAVSEMSQDQLASIVAALKAAQPTNFKARFQGTAGSAKAKVAKYWFNGELVTKEAHDKLSWAEVHASNNVIRK